ncbi:MAG: hypothetical protein KHY83_09625 [Coriobacteriia bacterium]|nr:hypothetical protein [Coriobacteriia bacterium]MBS5478907.1 hypothetical protein [Coriobacteriia bacterium]
MEEARALLELQQVDLAIIRDRRSLEAIPEGKQVQEVRAKLKELARRTTKIRGLLKDQEIETQDNDEKRRDISSRVEEVNRINAETTDFRKVKNNNAELDRLAKRLEKVDFIAGKLNEETQRLQGLMAQAEDVRTKLEESERALVEAFKGKAEGVREDLRRLMGERESLVASVPPALLAQYEASCKSHGMIGVAELEQGMCSGCRVQLQPSQIDALRTGPDISTCPVCGRMLVVRTSVN